MIMIIMIKIIMINAHQPLVIVLHLRNHGNHDHDKPEVNIFSSPGKCVQGRFFSCAEIPGCFIQKYSNQGAWCKIFKNRVIRAEILVSAKSC